MVVVPWQDFLRWCEEAGEGRVELEWWQTRAGGHNGMYKVKLWGSPEALAGLEDERASRPPRKAARREAALPAAVHCSRSG